MEETPPTVEEQVMAAAPPEELTPPVEEIKKAEPIPGSFPVQYTGEYDNIVANNGVEFYAHNDKTAYVTDQQWEELQHDEDIKTDQLHKLT